MNKQFVKREITLILKKNDELEQVVIFQDDKNHARLVASKKDTILLKLSLFMYSANSSVAQVEH